MKLQLTKSDHTLNTPWADLDWKSNATHAESTFHQLSPYIGKIKSTMASALVSRYTSEGDTVFDPFSGAGTVALEAWATGRNVIANDLSPYAFLLTKAKLNPYARLTTALTDIQFCDRLAQKELSRVDLRTVPAWVRAFFNNQTLREIMAWVTILTREHKDFLLACLLGILHHQRPGFLSFPSSHTVPYLRLNKFPRAEFPKLYEYRPLLERLEAKVERAFKRAPNLDMRKQRIVTSLNSGDLKIRRSIDAIITSPPYMRQLHYGRDNRLRLWFLGMSQWSNLDTVVSPSELDFFMLMHDCLENWKLSLKRGGHCVLVVGDTVSKVLKENLATIVADIAVNQVRGYALKEMREDKIPDMRRVRRQCRGSLSETIVVLVKE